MGRASGGAGKKGARRIFGRFEAVFNLLYIALGVFLGAKILAHALVPYQTLMGIAAFLLILGDVFHLAPRVAAALGKNEAKLGRALGRGKQITSITMTVFYLLLWQIGILLFSPPLSWGVSALAAMLAAVRIALCLFKGNRWGELAQPLRWAVYRNIPFVLLGLMTALLYGSNAGAVPALKWAWAAILLSFAFYLPVALFASKKPRLGMLMLPKTCMYLWLLLMFSAA